MLRVELWPTKDGHRSPDGGDVVARWRDAEPRRTGNVGEIDAGDLARRTRAMSAKSTKSTMP
ncbi:MAG TPA: hypothetical protein VFQ53_14195 [Kofleriaceae bacterium]|nr:hypothetical protein [Kofleriaceae bacterium]